MNVLAALLLAQRLLATSMLLVDAVNKAKAEGRDDLTDAELDEFRKADDAARAELQREIDSRSGS